MTTHRALSTTRVAELLGVHRTMIRHLADFPEPDVVIEGANGHAVVGWTRAAVAAWAEAHGRSLTENEGCATFETQETP